MNRLKLTSIWVLILSYFLLIGCSAPAVKTAEAVPATNASLSCPDPRPQICTREFRPVCALRDTGVRCVTAPCPSTELISYATACSACADVRVLSYTQGACSPDTQQPTN